MSEAERRKRLNYKRNRKRWITALTALLAVFLLLSSALGILYFKTENTYEIPYWEKGAIDYKVTLLQNNFYDSEELSGGQTYVSSLIDNIKANFSYTLKADEETMEYDYSYDINATLEIIDNDTKEIIFAPKYIIKEKTVGHVTGEELVIKESAEIDYQKYNEIAKSFLSTYGLSSVTSRLTITMKTDVNGNAEGLGCNSDMSYTSSFTVPLTKRTVSISITETAPGNEAKVFICNEAVASRAILGYSAIGGGALSAVLLIILILFIFLTRNHDINYSIKVKRLLNAYKSYIQKLKVEFDTSGYQVLEIDTFPEMLGIRDTIQSPILMSENIDETRTVFLIPTATKLLYLFEIKVDNYDQLYGSGKGDTEALSEEASYTPVPVSEECTDCEVVDAVASVINEDERIEEAVLTADGTECEAIVPAVENAKVEVRYRTSFMSRLIQSDGFIKEKYSLIKNYLLSFSGVKARTSLNFESFKRGHESCAKLNIKGSYLQLYLALEPDSYESDKYRVSYVGNKPKLETVPTLFKIKTERSMKQAYQLIDECMSKLGIEQGEIPTTDYRLPYESTEALVERDLIKVIAPKGVSLGADTPIEKMNVEELLRDKRHEQSGGNKDN